MAYEIVKRLKEQNNKELPDQLQQAVEQKDRQRNKQHEVWSSSLTGRKAAVSNPSTKSFYTCATTPVPANGICG